MNAQIIPFPVKREISLFDLTRHLVDKYGMLNNQRFVFDFNQLTPREKKEYMKVYNEAMSRKVRKK